MPCLSLTLFGLLLYLEIERHNTDNVRDLVGAGFQICTFSNIGPISLVPVA